MFYSNPFAPKRLVLPFLLFRQLPVFGLFVRHLAPGVYFLNAHVPQIARYLDFGGYFQRGLPENTDIGFAAFQFHPAMLDNLILLINNQLRFDNMFFFDPL